MSTRITPIDPGPGAGPRLAVKDLIDVAGVPTTAGRRAVADEAVPAGSGLPLHGGGTGWIGAAVIGKAHLGELAYGSDGINETFGTPVTPFDPALSPGDPRAGVPWQWPTGLQSRHSPPTGLDPVPAAFCGTTGLKTTYGRVSTEGVLGSRSQPGHDRTDGAGRDRARAGDDPRWSRASP